MGSRTLRYALVLVLTVLVPFAARADVNAQAGRVRELANQSMDLGFEIQRFISSINPEMEKNDASVKSDAQALLGRVHNLTEALDAQFVNLTTPPLGSRPDVLNDRVVDWASRRMAWAIWGVAGASNHSLEQLAAFDRALRDLMRRAKAARGAEARAAVPRSTPLLGVGQ